MIEWNKIFFLSNISSTATIDNVINMLVVTFVTISVV